MAVDVNPSEDDGCDQQHGQDDPHDRTGVNWGACGLGREAASHTCKKNPAGSGTGLRPRGKEGQKGKARHRALRAPRAGLSTQPAAQQGEKRARGTESCCLGSIIPFYGNSWSERLDNPLAGTPFLDPNPLHAGCSLRMMFCS